MNNFVKSIENLISAKRLESYNNSVEEHSKNLELISKLTPDIAMIEISIRNIVDFYITQKYDADWIVNSNDEKIVSERGNISNKLKQGTTLTHEQYLSNFSLGKIIRLVKDNFLEQKIFGDLSKFDFKDFAASNRNFYFYNGNKNNFTNYEKSEIILSLLLTIRNRSYHWENLLKTRHGKNNVNKFPRITHRLHETNIGIMPDKIEIFLKSVFIEICKE